MQAGYKTEGEGDVFGIYVVFVHSLVGKVNLTR